MLIGKVNSTPDQSCAVLIKFDQFARERIGCAIYHVSGLHVLRAFLICVRQQLHHPVK
jgi:hypothetical protein